MALGTQQVDRLARRMQEQSGLGRDDAVAVAKALLFAADVFADHDTADAADGTVANRFLWAAEAAAHAAQQVRHAGAGT